MKQRVSDLETLENYLDEVVGRHEHHAHGFKAALLCFAGFLVHYSERFEALHKQEGIQHAAWFSMNGKTFGMLLDPAKGHLLVKEGSVRGRVLIELTDQTGLEDVAGFFEANW
jgi:hypothetical protein